MHVLAHDFFFDKQDPFSISWDALSTATMCTVRFLTLPDFGPLQDMPSSKSLIGISWAP